MGLSFEDSLKQLERLNSVNVAHDTVDTALVKNANRRSVYLSDMWTAINDKGYIFYPEYSDEDFSSVDESKTVKLNSKQVNITQEENSQYIPFEMPRYYDGYDLVDTVISIHYQTKGGRHGASKPINVFYNDSKIKFGWLVDAGATVDAGTLEFEIHAYGTVVGSDGVARPYSWKTKRNKNLNVLESLCGCSEAINNIDDTWLQELVTDIAKSIGQEIADLEVGAQVTAAENAAKRAESAVSDARAAATDAGNAATNAVNSVLSNYVPKNKLGDIVNKNGDEVTVEAYVKEAVTAIDVTDKLDGLGTNDDGTPKTVVEYVSDVVDAIDISDKLGSLKNSEGEELTVEQYVNQEVAAVDISEELGDLVDGEGNRLTVEQYVKQEVAAVDVSDQLGDLGINEDGTSKTVVQYVSDAIESVDVSDQLGNLLDSDGKQLTVEQYVKQEVAAVDVSGQLSGYVTTDDLKPVRENAENNAKEIAIIKGNISDIDASLKSFEGDNKNLIIQYDEVGSVLHLYEKNENGDIVISDGDEQIKVKEVYSTVIIGGGGGGNSLVSTVKLRLSQDGEDSFAVLYGNDVSLNYNLSTRKAKETQDDEGNDVTVYEEAVIAGDITLTLYRDNKYLTHFTVTKTSSDVQSGSIDISDYIPSSGRYVFTVTASYVEQLGSDGESITVRSSADWAVEAVNLRINLDEKFLPGNTWETTPIYGSTIFSYTPIGNLEKIVYFKIDDNDPEEIVTSLNGTAMSYTIPRQTHGVHTLSVWCAGYIGSDFVSTDPYVYALMFVESGNNSPIIRIKSPSTIEQYSSADIYYNVFDPLNAIIDSVTIHDEDGVVLSSVEKITSAEQKYEFRPTVVKNKIITIQYKEYSESVTIDVTKFPYEIEAVTGSLMLDFVPTGRSNSDSDYDVFKNNAYTVEKDAVTGEEILTEIPITWEFSDNFDWINGGWKRDADGATYFCVKAGTYVDFNYNLFGTSGVIAKTDATSQYTVPGTGKEFKLIFKTTNVAKANATWLQCVDVADKKSLGIRMEAQNAYIDSGLGVLEVPYVDNDVIEFDMNIIPITGFLENGEPNLKTKTIPMIITYEDGTPVQPNVISSASTNFKQDNPKPITVGSEFCDVHIYRMKVYERYLEDKEIVTNFIADARSGLEMAKRFVKNDIYPIEDRQHITPESVAAACPDLKVYVLSAPHFTNDKGDKVANTTIRQIHNTGTKEKPVYDLSENWTATGATHNGQGTSSNEYGYSGRNLEFNMKKATITLNDNTTIVKEIQLSPTSYPTNYLNFKINIASSESANNALLQKRYDRYLPYTSVASLIDSRKKNSMEFFNCVVFIQETDENISNHREFSDTDIHFYGIGNIGDSKKTDDTRVNDVNDVNEFCVEIMDWNRYLSSFPMDTMMSTLYTDIVDGEEVQVLRFEHLLVDSNLGEDGLLFEKDSRGNYYHSTDSTVDKTKTYYIDILENDDFSEDYTYGFRYIQSEWDKDDDPDYKEKNEAFQKPLRQKWIEFYRFVTRDLTTNGVDDPAKIDAWKAEFSNWFITDAALYYYLYTLRYTMVDNRAKNTFWHWSKHYLTLEEALKRGIEVYDEEKNRITDATNTSSRFYDANGNEIKNINPIAAEINDGYRMDFWAYDNDTALGIDNAGKLEIPFGVEDEDADPAGVPYFRAYDSTVFVRIAKYFEKELEQAWHDTEINPVGKAFDSTGFINEFDEWQNQFPEELWRIDYERKYKRTYVGGTGAEWDNALPQSNKSDIVSTRFLTEMMNGRKKYQRRCFERNQEIYMSSKFKGEVNLSDSITLRGTGKPTNKVVAPNFTLNIVPFAKMYVNLYSDTNKIYYHERCEAGVPCDPIPYPETTLDFIYIRGASQIQSIGDLSPMYLQTAELTPGAKLKTITLGNKTDGYSNDSLKTLQIGAGNKLLEELDIRNLSNLDNTVLPVSNIPSLKRVYAQGSNISEAVFANNGLLEEAHLPGTITRLELRNLHYLNKISFESYDNLLHLIVINCPTMNDFVLDIINNSLDLRTIRVTNINWILDNTSVLERLYSLINDHDVPEVVLSGKIHVPTIRQKQFEDYQKVWPELSITYDEGGLILQHPVVFVNYDGTELFTLYVDEGGYAEDPVKTGLMAKPTRESSVSTDYTYVGWDDSLTGQIWFAKTVTATYSETIRRYTIRYVISESGKEIVLQESVGDYGTNVPYTKSIPTYDLKEGENGWTYYLFNRWDKSGFIDGDKTVTAIFDICRYTSGIFDGRELSSLSPVEIYALTKLTSPVDKDLSDYGMNIETGDGYSFEMGYDVEYDGIDSIEIISEKRTFSGSANDHYDTGITLFDEDRDFVLAIDYKMSQPLSGVKNATLMQCYQSGGTNGFKLSYATSPVLAWGGVTTATDGSTVMPSATNSREMLVVRHKRGDNNLYIYTSDLKSYDIRTYTISRDTVTKSDTATLVFGAAKADNGRFDNYAIGDIYWCKIWYEDLGDDICKDLVSWTHEKITLEVSGFHRYQLHDDTSKESMISLLATHLLSVKGRYNLTSSSNSGGWAECELRKFLNSRFYNAIPYQIRALIKNVSVKSTVGDNSIATSASGCFVNIPALYDVYDNATDEYKSELYEFAGTIDYFTGEIGYKETESEEQSNRIRKYADEIDGSQYWLRSPTVINWSTTRYCYSIDKNGQPQQITGTNTELGILIEISF